MKVKSVITNEKNQAMPAGTAPLGSEAFAARADTAVTWLGGAGILLNARGTRVMVDPVLEGFDMPVLFDAPVAPANVPALDAVLITHIDNEWHITFDGAVRLANTYPSARLLCIHWGTVDAPDWSTFNGDPRALVEHVVNPGRVLAPLPGEPVVL